VFLRIFLNLRGNLFIAGEVTFKGGEQLYLEQYFIVFIDL
jgi:hypothetical protein